VRQNGGENNIARVVREKEIQTAHSMLEPAQTPRENEEELVLLQRSEVYTHSREWCMKACNAAKRRRNGNR